MHLQEHFQAVKNKSVLAEPSEDSHLISDSPAKILRITREATKIEIRTRSIFN